MNSSILSVIPYSPGRILDYPFSRTTPLIGPPPSVPAVVPIKG